MRLHRIAIALALVTGWHAMNHPAVGQTVPGPPSDVTAVDRPNDVGNTVDVSWTLSPDDRADVTPRLVTRYDIYRRSADVNEFEKVGDQPYATSGYSDQNAVRNTEYLYQVVAVWEGTAREDEVNSVPAEAAATVVPKMEYFRKDRAWYGIIVFCICGTVVAFIVIARSGHEFYIRKIPGLEAVDEAVGRATEMGRSVFFIPGSMDINDIQTVAGITVLSRVSQLTAAFGAHLEVPTSRSLVMTVARETVEASYYAAGRPDAYNEDDIYYISDEQFGYVAGVMGAMVREKPAACFYMGVFYAEALLLAETGNSVGAIQVAGTAMPAQLPFFVAACDYTLIGEEFFAASAYLSGEPAQLGSLRGQDIGKLLVGFLLIVGCTAATIAGLTDAPTLADSILSFIKDNVLGNKGFLP